MVALALALNLAIAPYSWLSIAQARYGVKLEDTKAMSYARSRNNADLSLGWIWSAPRYATDTKGLGQAITWAWDPALCDLLLPAFKSDAFGVQMINCATIRTTMHRAFATWSQNHPDISFLEVTDLCAFDGELNENCKHAEVWVTYRNATRDGSTGGIAGAVQAAVALPTHGLTSDFVFTNGKKHELIVSEATPTRPERRVPLMTVEITGGRIEFAFETPICWYVDSKFCEIFHRVKQRFTDPEAVHATGAVILFTLWAFAAVAMIVEVLMAFRKQLATRAKVFVDRDGDGEVEAHEIAIQALENATLRVQAFLAAVAAESIVGTALRLVLLMIPWPFYIAIFQVCWNCYDFEAAAAHEIGHLLGIAHPDKLPGAELANGYVATNGSFYNTFLADGSAVMNATQCMHPFDYVNVGVPPSFPAADLVGSQGTLVRPSIMESFTTHNPSVCLFQDDYEALLSLYPVCSGMPPVPRCDKAHRNLGLLRASIFGAGPLCAALLISIFLHWFVERQREHHEKVKREARQAALSLTGGKKKHAPYTSTVIQPIHQEDLGVGQYGGMQIEDLSSPPPAMMAAKSKAPKVAL